MFGDLDWPLNASRGLSATAVCQRQLSFLYLYRSLACYACRARYCFYPSVCHPSNPGIASKRMYISSCFLPRDAMHKRGLSCRPVSVRPSVCPSVTLVYCIQTAEDIADLSVGLFSSTQPNPTHQITDPLPGELMDQWPNPTHTQPNSLTSNNNWPAVRK